MTCERVSAPQGAEITWTRRPKVSVIQRPQAVESPGQGHTPNSGRGRVASTVILAKRGSPEEGQSSTLSFPRWNQRWDSRAERENDSNVLEYVVVIMVEPFGGFFGRFAPSE